MRLGVFGSVAWLRCVERASLSWGLTDSTREKGAFQFARLQRLTLVDGLVSYSLTGAFDFDPCTPTGFLPNPTPSPKTFEPQPPFILHADPS